MTRFFLFIIFCCLNVVAVSAQVRIDSVALPFADSVKHSDSVNHKDSASAMQGHSTIFSIIGKQADSATSPDAIPPSQQKLLWELVKKNLSPGFSAELNNAGTGKIKSFKGKEFLFYLLVLLLIVIAFFRRMFPRYFNDLFRLFFRTTIKQRQIREQLMQTPLPSLLLNGFFVISAGLYASFLIQHYQLAPGYNFWLLLIYSCTAISLVYFVKFLGLKLTGWVFNLKDVSDAYIFIVFIVNKMIGILLLPFLVLLAFSVNGVYSSGLTLSLCLTGGLLVYRFVLSFAAVRNQVRVNPFHFFLYLCAFEIAPLLLIYKGLLLFFGVTA